MTTKAREKTQQIYKADQYSYSVTWSEDDGAFVARVAEFSSLAAHAGSQEKALQEIGGVVADVLEDLGATRSSALSFSGEAKTAL